VATIITLAGCSVDWRLCSTSDAKGISAPAAGLLEMHEPSGQHPLIQRQLSVKVEPSLADV